MKQETILVLGGDGYLGWSLGLALAARTDANIVLVDNLIKRTWERTVAAKLLMPIAEPAERIKTYGRIFGKNNLSFENVSLLDQPAMRSLLQKHRPTVILNAAQQPSAPFSMMSPENAATTFTNNVVGHLNVLWSIAEVDKSIRCVKLGSAGSYGGIDTSYLPCERVDLSFERAGEAHKVLSSWLPMQATDFYHMSKVSDFLVSDLCATMWGLRVLTVQQSTIFGATIPENEAIDRHELSTRFNYDAVFSTVINRFVCQMAIGHPMTVYGDGEQVTGIVSLEDTVANFIALCGADIKPGVHEIAHNCTVRMSVKAIAQLFAQIAGGAIEYCQNPRVESSGSQHRKIETHPMLVCHSAENFEADFKKLLDFTLRYKDAIDPSLILPKVRWEK